MTKILGVCELIGVAPLVLGVAAYSEAMSLRPWPLMTAAMFANAGMLIPGTVTLKSDAQLTLGNFNYMEGTEKLGVDGPRMPVITRIYYIVSRESRTKPSFATGIREKRRDVSQFVIVETSPGRFPIWSSAAPQGISQCWWSVRRRHPDQPEPRGWARAICFSQHKFPKIQSTRKVRKSVCLSYTPGSTNIAGWKIHHE